MGKAKKGRPADRDTTLRRRLVCLLIRVGRENASLGYIAAELCIDRQHVNRVYRDVLRINGYTPETSKSDMGVSSEPGGCHDKAPDSDVDKVCESRRYYRLQDGKTIIECA